MTRTTSTLKNYLNARREYINKALKFFLPAPPYCPPSLATAMSYSLESGGKRLRPILCLASAEAVAERETPGHSKNARSLALPAACAIELIHTYSLIHDDLPAMDNDTLRRGRPTLHVVADEGMAILAGDGLLTEAFGLMTREPQSSDPVIVNRKLCTIGVIAEAAGVTGMVGGQAIDLASVTSEINELPQPKLDADELQKMHEQKTGALISGAASAGAIMAGADEKTTSAINTAAAQMGLAFQIVDDVLDVEGSSENLGKTAGKDATTGKPTYPALYGLKTSKQMANQCIERAEATLQSINISDARLLEIGHWIIERTR